MTEYETVSACPNPMMLHVGVLSISSMMGITTIKGETVFRDEWIELAGGVS